MTAKNAQPTIPVVDVDQAFPSMVETRTGSSPTSTTIDQRPAVRTAIRDVLGVRSRREDPKAFVDALTAAFRLVRVEGHTESVHVPRGYAVQADLGAVSGGQASLYRRATIARTEILRILDGLTPLRTDADVDDMEAYRVIVRNSVQSLVDEMGLPGGPRVAMVDSYFVGLLGTGGGRPTPDTVTGQLGALRDRFGLIDDNVNTIEEEGGRTAFWTLVDLVRDLRRAWSQQRSRFGGGDGDGFLGTELIHISRLMEASADQVEELESVLDSVLIGVSERQTIQLDDRTNLTLDGLLAWLSAFLRDEGRRLAQDAGRDGIVSALAPTAVALAETFKNYLADPVLPDQPQGDDDCCPVRYLPASCSHRWPPGMYAARVQVAVASLCRLLMELARRAMRIGRYSGVVLVDISMAPVNGMFDHPDAIEMVNVEFRGLNLRSTYEPAFVPPRQRRRAARNLVEGKLVRPLAGTVTADGESISGLFRYADLAPILDELEGSYPDDPRRGLFAGYIFPAADFPCALVDRETGRVVHAPQPSTWPRLVPAHRPRPGKPWTSPPGTHLPPSSWTVPPTGPPGGDDDDGGDGGDDHSDGSWVDGDLAAGPEDVAERARGGGPIVRIRRHLDHLEQVVDDADVRIATREGRLSEVQADLAEEHQRRDRLNGAKASAVSRRIGGLQERADELAAELVDLRVVRDGAERARQEAEALLRHVHKLATDGEARYGAGDDDADETEEGD